jgi:23S rRNA (uracil1939-C5)-methyltransferase
MSILSNDLVIKKNDLNTKLKLYITNKNLFNIIPSPKKVRYRNNIMFSMGYDGYGKIVVGPFESVNSKLVKKAETNILVSDLAIKICEYMREWIINESNLLITEYPSFSGFWRHIQIKQNNKNDFIIGFRFSNFYKHKSIWSKEKYRLINYLLTRDELINNKYKLLNISYQECMGKKEPSISDPFYEIYNKGNLVENILRNDFIVNMGCFFQVNMYSSKFIYSIVKSLINKKKQNVLLDLCCGIGIYSIIFADMFYKVYGIDNNENNIILANENMEINRRENIVFIRDRVEDCIEQIMNETMKNKTVIVNPPRRGLYENVIETLNKQMGKIDQLIYISCNAETLRRDLEMLNLEGKKIKNIIPIDQFPNTEHYEIILNIIKLI